MHDTVGRYLEGFRDSLGQRAIRVPLMALADRYSSQALSPAGLAINAGGAAFPKLGAADFYAVASGVLVRVAAGTALPAPPASFALPAGGTGVVCYFVDRAGTVTALGSSSAANVGALAWPEFPRGQALVGILVVSAGGSPFTGGTTALDAATTAYLNPVGAFDPTVLT